MLTGHQIEGTVLLHKISPGKKVLALFVVCTSLFVFDNWIILLSSGAFVCGLVFVSRIPLVLMYESIKPVLVVLAIIFIAQLFLADFEMAAFVTLRFAVMICAASLVTLTTRASEFIEAVERALWFVRDKALVSKISLAFSLCLRFIPQVRDSLNDVREAQRARGLHNDWTALAVPTVVRTLKSADEISEAIVARSQKD